MNYTKFVYKKVFDFYQNEQGVYALLTAVISFVLLGIIALAVDGSGMLLDKARLSQGIEQGALALSAEANKPRIAQGEDLSSNGYFNSKVVSIVDKQTFSSKTDNEIKGYKRDQELLKGYVQSYLPDAKLPRDFNYDCTEQSIPKRVISCYAQGDIDRPSWLPLNNTSLTFQPEVKIASDRVYIGKNLDDVAPLDLMLVTDLSGSMAMDEDGKDTKATGKQSKISILREVVKTLSDELLDNNSQREDISPHNRIRFTSFAFGAAQPNFNYCYLPYTLTSKAVDNMFYKVFSGRMFGSFSGKTEFAAWKWGVENRVNLDNASLQVYGAFLKDLEEGINYPATVSDIASFNGGRKDYSLYFDKNDWCLGGNRSETTSSKWYVKGDTTALENDLRNLEPSGATLSSSGVLIGANLLMDKNGNLAAAPATIRTNTQRILLVLSDGRDTIYSNNTSPLIPDELSITVELINNGMCPAIIERLNTLQDGAYSRKNAKIHFVAFGYTASGRQRDAWKKCVGDDGYHEAKNKQQLLDTFRQITGLQEEVGHVTPNPIF